MDRLIRYYFFHHHPKSCYNTNYTFALIKQIEPSSLNVCIVLNHLTYWKWTRKAATHGCIELFLLEEFENVYQPHRTNSIELCVFTLYNKLTRYAVIPLRLTFIISLGPLSSLARNQYVLQQQYFKETP